MKTKAILNFRNSYETIFSCIRQVHMRRLVRKLKTVQTEKWVLSKEMAKEAAGFWAPYKKVPMLYHNFYTEKYGEFHKEYIPDEVYYNDVQPYFNNYRKAKVLDNKCYYPQMFPGILQPKLVASRINGFWYRDGERIRKEQVVELLSSEEEVFVKCAEGSGGGHGVRYLDCRDFKEEQFENAIRGITADIAIQRGIRQHEVLGKINPTSVNTIRIITLLTEEETVILSAILRMGVGETKVDNSSSGGMTIGIDEEGRLKKEACVEKKRFVSVHPTSGVVFEGYALPSFDKAKELVTKASLMVPDFRMVAWDVSILESGEPVLIEANLYDGQLDSHQIHNGPLFGERTEKVLQEVFQ